MVSKNELKQLSQLGQKKFRKQHGLFAVEGKKAITTFLDNNFKLAHCFGLEKHNDFPVQTASESELKKLSNHNSPAPYWAAFFLPNPKVFKPQSLNLALDGIRDPGNLGTIIRLCDWFGIHNLICSMDTVDCFNPKVVQASMGSLAKVQVYYSELTSFINKYNLTAIGTDAQGDSMYATNLIPNSILIMGNEGQGISETLRAITEKNISIPNYGAPAAESLNVAMATGILLSEFKRRS